MEQWKDIPSLPGYQASTEGRVRSVDRMVTDSRGRTYRVLGSVRQLTTSRGGYLRFNTTRGTHPVHLAVLEAFVGPRPPGRHGAHGDGDKTNNRPKNLRWATVAENAADKTRHGTAYRPQGERHPLAKLSDALVLSIRQRCAAGERQGVVARDLGLDARHIGKIARGEAWAHVAQNGVAFSDPESTTARGTAGEGESLNPAVGAG